MEEKQFCVKYPLGTLFFCAHEKAITYVSTKRKLGVSEVSSHCKEFIILNMAREQMSKYINGDITKFNVPVDLKGTVFQKKVWSQLMKIPYGETRSYADIAKAIKSPKAMRAVGSANAKNPVWIIVPCHRVIASNGDIAGYAGGVSMKKKLLRTEGIIG